MALNIKNSEMERLAAEVAQMAGETKTEAIKKALEERKERLALQGAAGNRIVRWRKFLEEEVWPTLPANERGRTMSKREKEEILGYDSEGV
jgi:antitoxin VapB